MKTFFTIIISCFSCMLLYSQPIITSDILLEIGDERRVSYVTDGFIPGDAGENISWDFSNVEWSYDVMWLAVDPDSTDFSDDFPTADIAFQVPGDSSLEAYTDGWVFYDEGDGEELSLLGAVLYSYSANPTDTNYFFLNEDPDLLFEFPMTYPDQFTDDIAGVNIVQFEGQEFEIDRSGTTTTEVDGYGTLITPEGTFENVIRVKRTEDITDEVFGIFTYQEVVRYDWYSPDYDYLLFHTEEIIVRDAGGNEQSRTSQTYYAEPHLLTAISSNFVKEMLIYPNPSSKFIHLPADITTSSSRIEIYNVNGTLVYHAEERISTIDIDTFGNGFYMVKIIEKTGKYHQATFIKN